MNNEIKKVILYPGEVRSRHDRDTHFIGVAQLMDLYGVLKTDNIKISRDGRPPIPQDILAAEGWIELYPRYDGNYTRIHDNPLSS